MTSKSVLVAGNLFHVICQRPPVPGCGDVLGNDLATTSKSSELPYSFSAVADSPLTTSATVTLPTLQKPCFIQQPDGCSTSMPMRSEICEPVLSKMDSLISLLNDHHGITYFRQFLSTRHAHDMLEFWLACVGYRRSDAAKCSSFALVIYKTFIAPTSSRLSLAGITRRAIRERLKSGNVDCTLFDSAVAEVETHLLRDYYPLFLESDDYAEYIRTRSSNQSPSCDGSSSGHSSNRSQSCTIDGDAGQHRDEEKQCKDSFSASGTLENAKTCGQISSNVQCTGDCLAATGYVVVLMFLFCLADKCSSKIHVTLYVLR